jgi:hypothetical protein
MKRVGCPFGERPQGKSLPDLYQIYRIYRLTGIFRVAEVSVLSSEFTPYLFGTSGSGEEGLSSRADDEGVNP